MDILDTVILQQDISFESKKVLKFFKTLYFKLLIILFFEISLALCMVTQA